MIYCGLKLTHDSAVSILQDHQLLLTAELEKAFDNFRHSFFLSDLQHYTLASLFNAALNQVNLELSDIDYFSIDGWNVNSVFGYEQLDKSLFNKQINLFNETFIFNTELEKSQIFSKNLINKYQNFDKENHYITGNYNNYYSFSHVYNHITSSYCTSPFAKTQEPSFVLVWDGGMYPTLYYLTLNKCQYIGQILNLSGAFYHELPDVLLNNRFPFYYGPISEASDPSKVFLELLDKESMPGKIMAYSALGSVNYELKALFKEKILENKKNWVCPFLYEPLKQFLQNRTLSIEDIITTLCDTIQELLISSLIEAVQNSHINCRNLCLAGGSFLNINWNTAIRNLSFFDKVWVPPFTNDSGSSIGACCSAMLLHNQGPSLDWTVYSGQALLQNSKSTWSQCPCDLPDLAQLLYSSEEPVVFLQEKAELGPRALGNRSILCTANTVKQKEKLNRLKKREWYRPIAPVCLEEYASEYFSPGCPDPYMLFNHHGTKQAFDQCPAVLHIDGTARLQTVNENQNKNLYSLLKEYYKLSGVPVLCNTSANWKGKGFFPSLSSAQDWCEQTGCKYIWNANILYYI